MDELRIEVDVKANDDSAKKTLDGLIKEYNDKQINLDIKLGKINVGELQSSINKLTEDLTALSNIKFNNLKSLKTNLKDLNSVLNIETKSKNGSKLESEFSDIERLVNDKEKSLKEIQKLETISKEIQNAFNNYNESNESALRSFDEQQKYAKSYIKDIAKSDESYNEDFNKVLNARMRLVDYAKQLKDLGVDQIQADILSNEKYDGTIHSLKTNPFVNLIERTSEEEEKALDLARKLGSNRSTANSEVKKYSENLSNEQKELIDNLSNMYEKSISELDVVNEKADIFKEQLKKLLNEGLPEVDKTGLNLNSETGFLDGYKRFFNALDEMKEEFNKKFGTSGDIEFNTFDDVNKSISELDTTIGGINLSRLKKELSEAFDIDGNILSNIEKIESALKQLNAMSDTTQKALFGNMSGNEVVLNEKIKEYLALDKSVNDALTKLSKSELSDNKEVINALNVEIGLLKQKQSILASDIRSNGGFTEDLKEQIRLQEELNKSISEVEQVEYKSSFFNKLHEQALKINQEFDEMQKKQIEISNFEMPDIFDTNGIKSYVDYLDSSAEGIKRILTQTLDSPGKDLVTTMYGDGTEVRKIVNNIEKSVNQLSTAYRQADNELTRLIKTQQDIDLKGDKDTSNILSKQISQWKDIKQSVEEAAKSANVYEQVMEKIGNSSLKNINKLDTNQSKIDFSIDVNNQQALDKFEEFKTKAFSNLQEIERKYKGTQLFDDATRQSDSLRNSIIELGNSLDTTNKIDLSNLSSEFRNINQSITQTKRDLSSLNKSIKSEFFDDLYDSMRTFTLGNIIGDAIQNGVYSIKETIVGLDSAMRDMMKVAPAGFEGTSEQLKTVKNDAIETAKAVGQSSEDVIQGMAKALQTGANTMQDALEIAKASATFAAVGDLSQEDSDTYIASIMSAYGGMTNALKPVRENIQGMSQDYNQLTKFTDLANFAGNNFAISTGDVGEALLNSGSILSEFGVSMEDAISMIVGANESVQDASKVGTAIKTMATNLGGLKASAQDGSLELNRTAKALQTIAGIDVYSNKQTGEVKDMMTILKELNGVWDQLSEDKQLAIAESIAGKHHINTLMAMMGNWDAVVKLQEDYANGFTVGSAQREQERYLNSIEGKWNALRENLKGFVTTVISSDFAKGVLDGAIAFTDGLTKVFKTLDDMNATIPVTIGLMSALGSSFKVLSGNGEVKLAGGLVDYYKSVRKEVDDSKISFAANNAAMTKAASNQVKLSNATVQTSSSYKKFSSSSDLANNAVARFNRENISLVETQKKTTSGMKVVASGFKNTAIASKLSMVGTTLLNGALVGLAVAGIGAAIKALDNYINRHEIAAEKTRESIDAITGEKQQYQTQKSNLEGIAKEYDNLAKKTNKSSEEIKRFNELKGEIATIMPDLVLGYDENNNPILAMQGNVTDLITELDRAIESKQRLLESKENDLGINATENIKKSVKSLKDSLTWMNANLNTGGDLTVNKALDDKNFFGSEQSIKDKTQKVIKALEDQEKAYTEKYNDHLENLEEYNSTEQEIQKKNLNDLFKKDNYKNLTDDLKGTVNSFAAMFDWGEYDLSGQRQMVNGISELSKAVSEGKIDLGDFNNKWKEINDTFQNTGNVDNYNKSINELAKELESTTGIDAGKWVEGLNQQFQGLDYADAKLNKFLESYGSSLDKLRGGDSVAITLKKQYEELANFSDLIDSEIIGTGKISVEPLIEVKESDSFKYLPQQIQTLIDGILADNNVTEAEQDVLLRLKTIIQNEGALDDDVAEQLNRIFTGNATEKDLKIGVKIGDYEIPPELVKILNDEYKDKNVGIDFKVNTEGIEKVEDANQKVTSLQDALNSFREEKSIKLLIDIVGEDKAKLYSEIIQKLPVNAEFTNKFIIENQEALSKLNSWKEVQEWLNKQPKEFKQKYGIEVEGADESKQKVEETKEKVEETNGKKATVEVGANTEEAKQEIDEVNQKKEELEKPTNLTVNGGELQGSVDEFSKLIEYSTKLKNGEYQISFKSNTEEAITQIDNLKLAVNNLSNQFMNIPDTTITINTELAAKNLSGLIVRLIQTRDVLSNISSKGVVVNTAQAAKNLSGLIARVREYINTNIETKTCNVETAQAAKNISGLIRKIQEINGINPKPIVFEAHTAQAAKNITGLINKIKQVPTTKTITLKTVQSGSVQNTPSVQSLTDVYSQEVRSAVTPSNEISLLSNDVPTVKAIEDTPNTVSMASTKATIDTPIQMDTNAMSGSIKYSIELFKELENRIQMVSNQLSVLDKKMKNATGEEKIGYLKDQNKLYQEQLQLQKDLEQKMIAQKNYYQSYLKGKGFQFTDDGNLKNYEEKLLALEKANEGSKDNNAYEETKKVLEEYIKVAFTDLPKVQEEFIDINNSLKDNITSVREFRDEIRKLKDDSRQKDENRDVDEVNNELSQNELKLETAVGKEREKLLQERVTLQERLKKETQDLLTLETKRREVLMTDLGEYDFTFRDDGSIVGYTQKIEALKMSLSEDDFKYVFDMVEEYLDTTYQKIPGVKDDLLEIGNTLVGTINDLEQVKIEQVNKDIERADEDELLGLYQQKLELQKELVSKKQEYVGLLGEEADKMKESLSEKGFTFNDDGSIANFEENVKRLQDEIKNTNDITLKDKLTKELQGALDCTKEYVNTTESELPKAVEDWKDAQSAVKDTNKEIEDIEKQQAKFAEDRAKAVRKATEDIMKVTQDLIQTQMDINKKQIDMLEKSMTLSDFDVTQSYETLNKQIALIEKQIGLQEQMNKEVEKQKDYYKNRLITFGIQFDSNGIATNAEKVLNDIKNQMASASDSDELDTLEEKFNDIVDVLGDYNSALESIVDGQSNLMDLKLEIQDVYENMLETTKKIEDKITDIISKQVEERKKFIDDELKKRLDSINKQKEAYNDRRDEDDWNKENEEKLKELNDLQSKIDAATRDTSLAGQAKLAELLDEFAKKQEEYDDFRQDKIDKDINDIFDKESDRIQSEADKAKEELDKNLDKEELYDTIKDALETGKLTNIDGTVTDLKDALIEYENKYGDGLSVIGGLIKKDLLSQLDISLDTMKNIESILKNLNISDFYPSTLTMSPMAIDFKDYEQSMSNYAVNFNESLITVQGNVTPEVMPELKGMVREAEERITRNIIKSMR